MIVSKANVKHVLNLRRFPQFPKTLSSIFAVITLQNKHKFLKEQKTERKMYK
jgi:hypothetical protein